MVIIRPTSTHDHPHSNQDMLCYVVVVVPDFHVLMLVDQNFWWKLELNPIIRSKVMAKNLENACVVPYCTVVRWCNSGSDNSIKQQQPYTT